MQKILKIKWRKLKSNTESKRQNKSTKVNLEKQFDYNCIINTIKKSNPNLSNKNIPPKKI